MARDLRLGQRRARRPRSCSPASAWPGCDMGACAILPRLIGHGRAAELLFTGRVMTTRGRRRLGFLQSCRRRCAGGSACRWPAQLATRADHRARGDQAPARRRVERQHRSRRSRWRRRPRRIAWRRSDFKRAYDAFAAKQKPGFRRATDSDQSFLCLAILRRAPSRTGREIGGLVRGIWRGHAADVDADCRALVADLGSAGFLQAVRRVADARPDVRSLAIAARDARAPLRPRRLRLRHAGARLGRDLAVRDDRAEARLAAQGRRRARPSPPSR